MKNKNELASSGDSIFYWITDKIFLLIVLIAKFILKLTKRTLNEMTYIKAILTHKERYIYLACTCISTSLLFLKYRISYTLVLSPFTYFILKAILNSIKDFFRQCKLDKISNKYKGISNMFDDRVRVIEVNDGVYKLYSYIPLNQIEKKKDEIEHYLNQKIVKIGSSNNNFRLISIYTYQPEVQLSKTYLLEDYMMNIKKDTKKEIQFVVGIDKEGNILTFDLVKLTHTFIAGMQGGGKSNVLNVIIQSSMCLNSNVFYIMTDFKNGVELGQYEDFENTVLIETLEQFEKMLNSLEIEMDSRYKKLKGTGTKKLSQYNKVSKKLPYIVLVIDEMSDIKLGGSDKDTKRIENILTQIMNKGRAAGILVIGATQRPSSTQINTNIRDRFGTKLSARIKDKHSQDMAGIKGTENLRDGEFMMEYIEDITKFKAFFINEVENNKVYENLSKKLIGGVKLDKII